MSAELPAAQSPPRRGPFSLRVARARHDLHNSTAHILGFAELWLEELQEKGGDPLSLGLELIHRTAVQIMARIDEDLGQARIEAGAFNLSSLQNQLCEQALQIVEAAESLSHEARARENELLKSDLSRIAAAARLVNELA